MKVCIIGCGEIGTATAVEMVQRFQGDFLHIGCVDPSPDAARNFMRVVSEQMSLRSELRMTASRYDCLFNEIPEADLYSISVFDQEDILQWSKGLLNLRPVSPAVLSIESTMSLKTAKTIHAMSWSGYIKPIAFPHRWNPGDPEHGVFNQPRLMGGCSDLGRELFRSKFGYDMAVEVDWCTAVLGKLTENAQRYMEIVLAQELRWSCEQTGVDYEALRTAVMTKWNMKHLLEARGGVGGRCLPKDLRLFREAFPTHGLAAFCERLNEAYQDHIHLGRIETP